VVDGAGGGGPLVDGVTSAIARRITKDATPEIHISQVFQIKPDQFPTGKLLFHSVRVAV